MTIDKIQVGFLGLVTTLIGGWDLTLQVLLILMATDVLTGLIKAGKEGEFRSKKFREGLWNKSGFIVVLILCYQLDTLAGFNEPYTRTVCGVYYIAVEGSSIIENLGLMGIPIPQFIKDKLAQLKDKGNSGQADSSNIER